MQKDRIDLLLAKLGDDSRLMTLEELGYLKSVFDSFEGRLYIEEKFISVIDSTSDEPYNYDFDGLYAKIDKQIRSRIRAPRRLVRIARIAATVIIPAAIVGGVLFYMGGGNGEAGETKTIALIEDNVRLILPDGSEIILDNTTENSRIAEHRDVVLSRENGSLVIEKATGGAAAGEEVEYGDLRTPRGTRFDMVLEDGSRVWLNADSRIRFPSVFAGSERRVYLEGEGWFDVSHDAARPFIVETPGQELTVLGTSFNISAYRNDAVTLTTLVEGSVALKSQWGETEIVLRPGQQARLNTASGSFTTLEVDADSFPIWKDGIFLFEGNTLEQAMRQLARWYDMDYTFADERAKSMVLRGKMPIQADISRIFDILETSGRVKFLVDNNKVTIQAMR